MGRRCKSELDVWIPTHVYKGKSVYAFYTKDGRCIRLAPLAANKIQVIHRHDKEVKNLQVRSGSLEQLVMDYMTSSEYQKPAPKTQ